MGHTGHKGFLVLQTRCITKHHAERKAGRIFLEVERQPGKRTDITSSNDETRLKKAADDAEVPMPTVHK